MFIKIINNKKSKYLYLFLIFTLICTLIFGFNLLTPKKAFPDSLPTIQIDWWSVNGGIYLEGWAADTSSTNQTGIDRIDVYLDGNTVFLGTADYGISRPDVAKNFNNPNIENSGFTFWGDISGLSNGTFLEGTHTVDIYAMDKNKTILSSKIIDLSQSRDQYSKSARAGAGEERVIYNLDSPALSSTVSGNVIFSGWAANPGMVDERSVWANSVELYNRETGEGFYPDSWVEGSEYRPDVAKFFGDVNSEKQFLVYSGWGFLFDTSKMSNGDYEVWLKYSEMAFDKSNGSYSPIRDNWVILGSVKVQN